jgi:hypothetical protein
VAFTTFYLLSSIVTPLLSAYSGGLGRLGVHYPSARFGIPYNSRAQAFADRTVHPLPAAVDAPGSELMKDSLPRREVVRQKAPRAAAPQYVEDGVEDLTQTVDPGSPGRFRGGELWLQAGPFCIGEVG